MANANALNILNLRANNILKQSSNANSGNSNGSTGASFSDILRTKYISDNNYNYTEPEKVISLSIDEEKTEKDGVLKLLEIFGSQGIIPQDIIRQLVNDFIVNDGESFEKTGKIFGGIVSHGLSDDLVSGELKQILRDVSNNWRTVADSGGLNQLNFNPENTDLIALSNLSEKPGFIKLSDSDVFKPMLNDSVKSVGVENVETILKNLENFVANILKDKNPVEFDKKSFEIISVKTDVKPQVSQNKSGVNLDDMVNFMKIKPAELKIIELNLPETIAEPAVILNENHILRTAKPTDIKESIEIITREITEVSELGLSLNPAAVNKTEFDVNYDNLQEVEISEAAGEISNIISNNIGRNGFVQASGSFEIKMKLSPKELGELQVKVSYNKGDVILNIAAANKVAELSLLNRMSDLRESLESRGINLADVEIVTSENNANYGGQNNYQSEQSHSNGRENNRGNNRDNNFLSNLFNVKDSKIADETARNQTVINYLKNRNLLFKTI